MISSDIDKDVIDPQKLIEGYFLGALTEEESSQLENLLLNDKLLRRDFLNASALDSDLRDLALKRTMEPSIPQTVPFFSSWTILHRVAAVAVLCLSVYSIWFCIDRLRYPTVARITDVSGDVTVRADTKLFKVRGKRRLWSGMQIEGSGQESSGIIVWKDGSTMRLAGNIRINIAVLDGQKRVDMSVGTIDCNINRQAQGKPLILSTPRSRLEILGTVFRARTTGEQSTTEVVHGRVRVERISDGKALTLSDRQKLVIEGESDLKIEDFYWGDRFKGSGIKSLRKTSSIVEQTSFSDSK